MSFQDMRKIGVDGDGLEGSATRDVATSRSMNFFTYVVLFTASMGGLVFGLDIGTAATTSVDSFRRDMGFPILEPGVVDPEWVVHTIQLFPVIFHVTSLLGAPFAGIIADRVGRKPVILVSAIVFALGALWQTLAGLINPSNAWTSIILGRALGGIGNGFILTVMPVYASELSPSAHRGKTVTVFQLMITIGIFIMALCNQAGATASWDVWRLLLAAQIIPCAFVVFLTLFVLPESPRFLVMNGKEEEARAALVKLNEGSEHEEHVAFAEYKDIKEEVDEERAAGKGGLMDLVKGTALPATLCGVGIATAQNLTGVNWLMNFGTQLFHSLGMNAFLFDTLLKGINVLSTIAALFVIDRLGRKFLTQNGLLCMVTGFLSLFLAMVSAGVDVTDMSATDETTRALQAYAVAVIFFFQVVFAISWGPLGWLVPGEVFPLRVRGVGMSCAVVGNMATNILLGDFGYQYAFTIIGFSYTILFLVALNVLIVLPIVVFLQPETKNLTMEQIRLVFNYQSGGNAETGAGTMKEFYARSSSQSLALLRCRLPDPLEGAREIHVHDVEKSVAETPAK